MADLKTLANDVYATISKHDLEGFLDYIAEDVIEHEPPPVPDPLPGKAGVRQWFEVLFTAFPDVTMTPEDLIVEGDKGAARVRLQAPTAVTSWASRQPASRSMSSSSTSCA